MDIITGSRPLMGLGTVVNAPSASAADAVALFEATKAKRRETYDTITANQRGAAASNAVERHRKLVTRFLAISGQQDALFLSSGTRGDYGTIAQDFRNLIRDWEALRQEVLLNQSSNAAPPIPDGGMPTPPPAAPPAAPPTQTYTPPITTAPPTGLPPPQDRAPPTEMAPPGMSRNTKIMIGVGALAVLGVVVFMMRKNK